MPPKLPLPDSKGHFFLFQNCPRGEGIGDLAMSAVFLPQPLDCFTESQTQYILI